MKNTCPFGSTCKKTDNQGNILERCMLYVEFERHNLLTQETRLVGECAITWQAIFQHEANQRLMGVQQATESFRNEMVDMQMNSNTNMALAMYQKALELSNDNSTN